MKHVLIVGLLAAGLDLGAAAGADNWPEFRGPTGQGHVVSGKLPLAWGPTKNVAWKAAIPGLGWSSPIVFKGKIYLTTAVTEDKDGKSAISLRTLCLDATDG